jgi:hypothetical protein
MKPTIFVHSDMLADLKGWMALEDYSNVVPMVRVATFEVIEGFRFVETPAVKPFSTSTYLRRPFSTSTYLRRPVPSKLTPLAAKLGAKGVDAHLSLAARLDASGW